MSENVKKLNIVAGILDFWRPSWIDNGEFLTIYSIYDNDHLYQFFFYYTFLLAKNLEHDQCNSFAKSN